MRGELGDRARLGHILGAILELEKYNKDGDFDAFVEDSMRFHASVRQLEIIGEAAGRLSDELKEENKDIPWRSIVGLRNLVVHEYFGVDDKMIWEVIRVNIPSLKRRVEALLI